MNDKYRELIAELKTGLDGVYGPRLRGVYLYGSAARGDEGPESDVDVLLVLDQIGRYSEEIRLSGEVVSNLSLKFGRSISRVFVPEQEWKTGKTTFLENARAESISA